jgi:hypothetical protein
VNLDATIKQLRLEIERLKATLAILENLQRQRKSESHARTVRRESDAAKKKPKPRPKASKR